VAARDALYRTSAAARSVLARDRTWTILFLAAAAISLLGFLYATRYSTFWHDEWDFIAGRRNWDLAAFMEPHNEHWAAGAVLVYKVLLTVFGLHSYTPYMAVLLLLHVAAAAAVYRLVAWRAGRPIALGASLMLLFFTSSAENLYWAFQIGFVGAAALGAWALVLTLESVTPSPGRLAATAALLTVAVATSGVGLFFWAALAVVVLLNPARRRHVWTLLVPLAAYAAWYLAFGTNAVNANAFQAPPSSIADYVVVGIGNATGWLLGIGQFAGSVLAVIAVIWAVGRIIGPRPLDEAVVAGVTGLLAQFVVTGATRAQLGPEQAMATRYLSVAAIFLLMLGGAWLASVMPRSRWSMRRAAPLVLLMAWAIASNLARIHDFNLFYTERGFETRAAIAISLAHGGSPALPETRGGDAIRGYPYFAWFPSPAVLRQIDAQYGLPPTDEPIPAPVTRRILFQLVSPSIVTVPGAQVPDATESIEVEHSANVAFGNLEDGCLAVRPLGAKPSIEFAARGGSTIYATPDASGPVRLYLSLSRDFAEDASRHFQLAANGATAIAVPDLGDGSSWHVRLDTAGLGGMELCLGAGDEAATR